MSTMAMYVLCVCMYLHTFMMIPDTEIPAELINDNYMSSDMNMLIIYHLHHLSTEMVLFLSPHNAKIIYANFVTSGVVLAKYGGWGLLMFPKPPSKCSGGFPYIFFITLPPVTFIYIVDDSTFFSIRSFVLRSHQEASDGLASFEVDLHSIFAACSFQTFTQPFVIWHHYVRILVLILVACIAALILPMVSLGWCFHFDLHPVECPYRVLASCYDSM